MFEGYEVSGKLPTYSVVVPMALAPQRIQHLQQQRAQQLLRGNRRPLASDCVGQSPDKPVVPAFDFEIHTNDTDEMRSANEAGRWADD